MAGQSDVDESIDKVLTRGAVDVDINSSPVSGRGKSGIVIWAVVDVGEPTIRLRL